MALGKQAAPHIRAQGEKYIPQVFKSEGTGKSKIDNVVEVAAGSLTGMGLGMVFVTSLGRGSY